MALVAGVLGVLVLAAGLVADANRSDAVATPTATLDTALVVIGPEILALAPEGRVSVTGDGPLIASAARPADAQAWLGNQSVAYVTGVSDWETLGVRTSDRVEPLEPEATPSPEVTDGTTPSPEVTEGAAAEDDATDADAVSAPPLSTDHWRETWTGDSLITIPVADIPVGMPLIVQSADGSVLTDVDLRISRDLNEGWIAPLIWWGIFLTAVGLIALLFLVIDTRPVQERTETWLAHRRHGARTSASSPNPGSRRARRAAGDPVPVADMTPEVTTSKGPAASVTDSASTEEERS